MLILKLKNSKLKLSCTGPGPTNTRDEVTVTGEYLGCTGARATPDTIHHNVPHVHYSFSFTVSAIYGLGKQHEQPWAGAVVSSHLCPGLVASVDHSIGRYDKGARAKIQRHNTQTHWPLDITIIHSLAILCRWENLNSQLNFLLFATGGT